MRTTFVKFIFLSVLILMASQPAVVPKGSPGSSPSGACSNPHNCVNGHHDPQPPAGRKHVSTNGDHGTLQNKDHP